MHSTYPGFANRSDSHSRMVIPWFIIELENGIKIFNLAPALLSNLAVNLGALDRSYKHESYSTCSASHIDLKNSE